MARFATLAAAVRLIHPAPALAVTLLSAGLGWIILAQAGMSPGGRWAATVLAIAGSQIFTGAVNDLVDRGRDQASARTDKPLATGQVSPEGAVWIASIGLAIQLAASLRLGLLPLALGVVAAGSATAYNLWLSRRPLSVLPYLVSFGVLPLWIAAGVGIPLERVTGAALTVAPFAAAAHLANALRDFDADALLGSRNLAQVLGRGNAFNVAWGLAMGVGVIVGLTFALGGRAAPLSLALGGAGLLAVAQGIAGPQRLWIGMLVAAVCWTVAWALATG